MVSNPLLALLCPGDSALIGHVADTAGLYEPNLVLAVPNLNSLNLLKPRMGGGADHNDEKPNVQHRLTQSNKLLGTRLPAHSKPNIACSNYLDQMQFICLIFVLLCPVVTYKCHCGVYLL